MLARDRAESVRHLAQVGRTIAEMIGGKPGSRASRLAIEFGLRFYSAQINGSTGR